MPWAKGVSIKDTAWDGDGNQSDIDFTRMMQIVVDAGYNGYCGIEYGGFAGLNSARQDLESARENLTSQNGNFLGNRLLRRLQETGRLRARSRRS
jgi:hypothetical protein